MFNFFNKNKRLFWAIKRGDKTKVVKILSDKKVDINYVDQDNGDNALNLAIKHAKKDIIEILLANGAYVELQNAKGNTPLILAVLHEREDIVELLLKYGAKVNNVNGYSNTPLIIAVKMGKLNIAKLLLENGADASHINKIQKTALYFAAQLNNKDITKLLLEAGAEVGDISKFEETFSIWTTIFKNLEILQLLFENVADINVLLENDNVLKNIYQKNKPLLEEKFYKTYEEQLEKLFSFFKDSPVYCSYKQHSIDIDSLPDLARRAFWKKTGVNLLPFDTLCKRFDIFKFSINEKRIEEINKIQETKKNHDYLPIVCEETVNYFEESNPKQISLQSECKKQFVKI